MYLPLYLTMCILTVNSLRVCTRRHYSIYSNAIFQRVELPTANKCVERCIENLEYCKAVVFVEIKMKSLGFCVIHTVNSEKNASAFHPDASIDPVSTVHEILDTCPHFATSEMNHKISKAHRMRLEEGLDKDYSKQKSWQLDAFLPDGERLIVDDGLKIKPQERYATMKPVDGDGDPRNPFDNERDDSKKTKSLLGGLRAIRPVMVLHQGSPVSLPFMECKVGVPCISTVAFPDSSPCPARQGDPCAPKPPCMSAGCYHVDAPVQTSFSEWMEWSLCSVSCGMGTRRRQCSGLGCSGPSIAPCSMPPCSEWTPWSSWTLCSASCGAGERQRSRVCQSGRRDCEGASMAVESCSLASCPTWSNWGLWQECPITCGISREKRMRKCENGLFCPGSPFEERICDRGPCPHWGAWTPWSQCTKTCATGETIRTRECINGIGCTGGSEERLLCNQQECPQWAQWTAWTVCDDTCGEENYRLRNRLCLYRGLPFAGCEGSAQDQTICPAKDCAEWSEWGEWSECSVTCGQGNQLRTRKCRGGTDCSGSDSELRFCQIASCPYWGDWEKWGGCSVSCGLGVCERRRRCIIDEILNIPNQEELDESSAEFESDDAKAALIAKSKHIRTDSKNESREVDIRRTPLKAFIDNTGVCDGADVDRKSCDAGPCCVWDSWTEWSPCIGCGAKGISKRNRQCLIDGSNAVFPSAVFQEDPMKVIIGSGSLKTTMQNYATTKFVMGDSQFSHLSPIIPINHRIRRHYVGLQLDSPTCHCPGNSMETRPCPSIIPCSDPQQFCQWSDWGEWCGCTKCRAGREIRRRFCDLQSKEINHQQRADLTCKCAGTDIEERTCLLEDDCFQLEKNISTLHNIDYNTRDGEVEQKDSGMERNSGDYIPIDSRLGKIELYRGNLTLDRKDSALKTTPFPFLVCRWSKWSEWSTCHENKLIERNRFCIGNDALVSNCECIGLSTEQKSCNARNSKTQTTTLRASEETKENSGTEFSAEEDSEIVAGLDSALKSEDIDEFINEETEDELKSKETKENEVIKSEKSCEWSRWSRWSDCTTTCGTGEILRKRRCSCGDGECGEGIETEVEACEKMKCPEEKRRYPVFRIY